MSEKTLKILSIDGGGIRGAIPLYYLNQIEKKFNIRIRKEFDVFAGTSTGAVIGSSIVSKNPSSGEYNSLDEILDIYINRSNQIFIQKESANTKYSNQGLELILKHFFGNLKLSDIKKILVLPIYNLTSDKIEVLSQWNDDIKEKYKEVSLNHLLLAASASQGFFTPVNINNQILGDGVVQFKNPSIKALDLAINKGYDIENIKILSLGTGKLDILDEIETQSMEVDQQLKYLFTKHKVKNNYLRIQPPIFEGSQDMDNTHVSNLKALIEDAKNHWKSSPELDDKIEKFLQ